MTDTEWTPPIETGLSGSVFVTDALAEYLDTHDDSERNVHAPAVYALRLSTPDDSAVVRERWERYYDVDAPEFVRSAFEADRAYYAGSTHNCFDRLTQHAEGEKTASICRVYPPHSIHKIWWYDDADTARDHESGHAIDLQNTDPTIHVHQN